MRKLILIAGAFILLVIGVLIVIGSLQKAKSRRALESYLADLRAQGEALSWEELGYPPSEQTVSINPFLSSVERLRYARPDPSQLRMMRYTQPGLVEIGWTAPNPIGQPSSNQESNSPTWEQFTSDMQTASIALAELREFLQMPPCDLPINLTNPFATERPPFVHMRTAAYWLVGDTLAALHGNNLEHAQTNLHGMTQLAQMYGDGSTLTGVMIQVAIAQLGLNATWEALQAGGWENETLERLQQDWERIDLIDGIERSMVAHRIRMIQIVSLLKESNESIGSLMATPKSKQAHSIKLLNEHLLESAAERYWRIYMEEDLLLYLKEMQKRLETVRLLQTNSALEQPIVMQLDQQYYELMGRFGGLFDRSRHLLTTIAMPSYSRAVKTMIRTETHRRLTIIAIALKRYQLQTGHYPSALQVLVPDYLSSGQIDPMSGQPFHYRTDLDGTFTLYSVGRTVWTITETPPLQSPQIVSISGPAGMLCGPRWRRTAPTSTTSVVSHKRLDLLFQPIPQATKQFAPEMP